MSAPVIAVRDVSKRYRHVVAVDNVTLDIRSGEVYALLGLNGAGKTTLIRMMLGMVSPTAGSLEVTGRRVPDRARWSQVGYLVESPAAYPELTVRENLEVVRRLRKVDDRSCVDDAMDLFGLRPYAGRRARALSLGNVQRLGLAKAFLHKPSLLLLDEPVNSLDPAGVAEIRDLVVNLARDHGVTVFLSSHRLAEVARVATRIGVLHQGRLVDEFEANALASRVLSRLEVGTRDLVRAAWVLREAGFEAHHPAGGPLPGDSALLVLEETKALQHPELVAAVLAHAGEPPTRIAVVEEDLETYFLRLVNSTTTAATTTAATTTAATTTAAAAATITATATTTATTAGVAPLPVLPAADFAWGSPLTGEIAAALWAELLKVRRSVVPWVTVAAFTVAGLVGGFFMFVLQDPGRARSLGLLGAKAQLAGGTADWAGYFAFTAQIAAVGGLLVFSLIVIWLFGREFTDGTAKDLLALPTSRTAVVEAKLLVALGWCLLLAFQLVVSTLLLGTLLGLPGWSAGTALRGLGTVFATTFLTVALTATYGLAASLGRGYLAAVAAMFVSLFAAQVIAALGFGAWFPWSVPSLLSGVAGPAQAGPGPLSIAGVIVVGAAASAATGFWWEHADHDR